MFVYLIHLPEHQDITKEGTGSISYLLKNKSQSSKWINYHLELVM